MVVVILIVCSLSWFDLTGVFWEKGLFILLACREHKGDPPRGDPPCAQNCAFDSFYVLKATQSKCLIYPNCSQLSVGFTNFTAIPKRINIPTYTCNKKLSPAFLWISNFDVKLGVVEYHFQNYPMYVSFQIFGYKNRLLFSLIQWCYENSYIFLTVSKTLFAIENSKKFGSKLVTSFLLFVIEFNSKLGIG